MKVLLVVHNFLPDHTAGTEIYTAQLGVELVRRGHAVHVFTAEKDIGVPELTVRERVHAGLPVTEIVNNLYHTDFRATWDHPGVTRVFAELLDRLTPDAVHVQHLMYLSIGCVEEAAARGIPVVFTLHDFWLHCPRFGQRVHADGSLCDKIDFARCGGCMAGFKHSQTPLARRTGQSIAALNEKTGINLAPAARGAARLFESQTGEVFTPPDSGSAAAMTAQIEERDRAMRARVVPRVSLFLSPSRFLQERFVEWGIPAERIRFLRTGIDPERFRAGPRKRGEHQRVAFLGTFAPHKGAHVLIEAWERLDPALRARARLELYGSSQHHPEYVSRLRRRAREVGAVVRDPLPRDRVADELRAIDLLVVPSVWYENSPLVIIEALAVRTPLLVSDIGGMAELVSEGKSGFHFAVGDVADLARHLTRLLTDPSELARLYAEPEPIKHVADDALQLEELYLEAIDQERARWAAPPS